MKNEFLANVVWLMHILFVLWVVIVPFTQNKPMLVLHLVMVPFIQLHWLLSNDTCALTVAERWLRGVDKSESFFHNLVSPIYVIKDEDIRAWSWLLSFVLWFITLTKVVDDPSMIASVFMPWKSPEH
jgi:hypothetical protein